MHEQGDTRSSRYSWAQVVIVGVLPYLHWNRAKSLEQQ